MNVQPRTSRDFVIPFSKPAMAIRLTLEHVECFVDAGLRRNTVHDHERADMDHSKKSPQQTNESIRPGFGWNIIAH